MNLSEVRHTAGRRITSPLTKLLCKTGVSPNTLTLIGLAVSGIAAAFIARDALLLGGILILFSGVFDLFDGPIARATGQTTKFGAILDSTCDRIAEATVLLGLLILYIYQHSTMEPILIYVCLAGSVLVSYIRARAEGMGIKCEEGIFTRAERVIVLAAGLIVGYWVENAVVVTLWILAVFSLITALQRLIYVSKAARE